MQILVAIDGAASAETAGHYATRNAESFVSLLRARAADRSAYFQGPHILVGSMTSTAAEVVRWLETNSSTGDAISLLGYSRGAATCLLVAQQMSRSTLDGRFLVSVSLFDAVANDPAFPASALRGLPNTSVRHARRRDDVDNLLFPRLDIQTNLCQQSDFAGDHTDLGGAASWNAREAFNWISDHLRTVRAIR